MTKSFIQELHPQHQNGEVKIRGTLTSPVQLRGENTSDHYYYAFVKLKGQTIDLPVIFKIRGLEGQLIEPKLKKGEKLELTGHYSISEKSVRKSITCTDYQLTSKKEENIFTKNA